MNMKLLVILFIIKYCVCFKGLVLISSSFLSIFGFDKKGPLSEIFSENLNFKGSVYRLHAIDTRTIMHDVAYHPIKC